MSRKHLDRRGVHQNYNKQETSIIHNRDLILGSGSDESGSQEPPFLVLLFEPEELKVLTGSILI